MITSLNRPHWLNEATRSVLDQDYENLEVVIIDDASDVVSVRDVAHDLTRRDQRVEVVINAKRVAPYRSLAAVGPKLTGDYFAILNDDDRWESGFLNMLTAPLDADADLVASFCDHYIINRDGDVDEEATDKVTRRCGRDNLAPGRHNDSAKLRWGSSSFNELVGALFRIILYCGPATGPRPTMSLDLTTFGFKRVYLAKLRQCFMYQRSYPATEYTAVNTPTRAISRWRGRRPGSARKL